MLLAPRPLLEDNKRDMAKKLRENKTDYYMGWIPPTPPIRREQKNNKTKAVATSDKRRGRLWALTNHKECNWTQRAKSQLLRMGGGGEEKQDPTLLSTREMDTRPMWLTHDFYWTFKEERIPVVCNSYTMPVSCYEFSIVLIPKWSTYIIQNEIIIG